MLKPLTTLALIASLSACAAAGSPVRTATQDGWFPKGQVEIRVKNYNWSTARIFVASSNSRPIRIMTVPNGRVQIKRIRVYSTYFVIMVSFIAGNESWTDYYEWSIDEKCLYVTVEANVSMSHIEPCAQRVEHRTE